MAEIDAVEEDRGSSRGVRRPFRIAAVAAVVLLVSWAPLPTEGFFVPDDEQPTPQGPRVSSIEPTDQPYAPWSAASLSEPGQCLYLTVSPVPGGGSVAVPKDEDPSGSSCHHAGEDDHGKPGW